MIKEDYSLIPNKLKCIVEHSCTDQVQIMHKINYISLRSYHIY